MQAPSVADEIAQAAGLAMRSYWTPTAANYRSHVSRAQVLETVREAVSPEIAGALSKLTTKAALAEAAEKRLAGTGWSPKLLKAGAYSTSRSTRDADREVGARDFLRCRSSGPNPEGEIERRGSSGGGIAEYPVYRAVLAVKGRGRGRPRP